MLLKHASGKQRGFQAMCGAMTDHLPERSLSVATRLSVVRQMVKIALDTGGPPQPADETPFGRQKLVTRMLHLLRNPLHAVNYHVKHEPQRMSPTLIPV
jgi:hypothetical protein